MGLDSLSLGALMILVGIVFLPLVLAITTESGVYAAADGDERERVAEHGQAVNRV
ncbi:MAG: hypothetical protein MI920_08210 [Kiloniellales bacterium]|nr:hypothetical protein [Kiloniellales bacterium]